MWAKAAIKLRQELWVESTKDGNGSGFAPTRLPRLETRPKKNPFIVPPRLFQQVPV
jgi:hypothetical protein